MVGKARGGRGRSVPALFPGTRSRQPPSQHTRCHAAQVTPGKGDRIFDRKNSARLFSPLHDSPTPALFPGHSVLWQRHSPRLLLHRASASTLSPSISVNKIRRQSCRLGTAEGQPVADTHADTQHRLLRALCALSGSDPAVG